MANAVITNTSWNKMSARVTFTVAQDIAANTSRVTVTGLELNSNGYYGSCFVKGTIQINGQEVCSLGLSSTEGHGIALAVGAWNAVGGVSGTPITVSHDAEGNRSITISVSLSASPTSGSGSFTAGCSGSISVSLPTIPRVSVITADGGVLGENMTIAISRASSGFTDTITYSCGDATGTIAENTGETSIVWTPPVSLSSQNTTGITVSVVLKITTYSNGTELGSNSIRVTCTIPSSVVPTAGLTVTDKSGYLSAYGNYIQARSQAQVAVAASGVYGSTISSVSVTCGELSGFGTNLVFDLPESGTITIRAVVSDSRGRSTTVSTSIPVASYAPPSAWISSVYRCDSQGQEDSDGAYAAAVFGAEITALNDLNTASYTLKYRTRGSAAWSSILLSGIEGNYSPSGVTQIFPAGIDSSYEVCLEAADAFSSVISAYRTLQVAFKLLDFDRAEKAIGIGQRATVPGVISAGLPVRMYPDYAPENSGDVINKGHLDSILNSLIDALHPVGSIYMSVTSTSPAALFGGTWERLKDRFLLAGGDAWAPGSIGGESGHQLTAEELPAHSHTVNPPGVNDGASVSASYGNYPTRIYQDKKSNWNVSGYSTAAAGGGQPHNNMPPFLAVYIWKRTA